MGLTADPPSLLDGPAADVSWAAACRAASVIASSSRLPERTSIGRGHHRTCIRSRRRWVINYVHYHTIGIAYLMILCIVCMDVSFSGYGGCGSTACTDSRSSDVVSHSGAGGAGGGGRRCGDYWFHAQRGQCGGGGSDHRGGGRR